MSITRKEWEAVARNINANYLSDGRLSDEERAGCAQRAVSRAAHGICDTLAELARGSKRGKFNRREFLELCGVPHSEGEA